MGMIAEAVRHMMSAGMDPEAIVAAIGAMESANTPVRTARQERNARYYSRKKASESRLNASEQDVSDDQDASRDLSFPEVSPHTPLPNPSNPIPPSPPKGGSSPTPKISKSDCDAAFERFRQAYPRRDGSQDWPKARETFDRALKAGIEAGAIIAGAARYAEGVRKRGEDGSRFVKQARTWLNGRLWEEFTGTDEPSLTAEQRPPGWPDRLPPPDACFSAWSRGTWPGAWGAAPGDPGCRLPADVIAEWQDRMAKAA